MPALVIEIGWGPNIATIGGLLLTWHGLFTALGILGGVQLALRVARRVGLDEDDAYALALVGVPGGIVGARLLYVAERWGGENGFGANPAEIIAINEGGISIWGAVLGGFAASYAFGVWRKYPLSKGLDVASLGMILGMAIGRIGDIINGEHSATATDLPWGVVYTNAFSPGFNRSFLVGATHPAVAYELIGDLLLLGVLFFTLFRLFRRWPGLTFIVFFVGYSTMRFFLTYLRVDSESVLGLRVPQLVSVLVVLGSLPVLWYLLRRGPRPEAEGAAQPAGRVAVAQPASAGGRGGRGGRRSRRGRR